MQVGILDVERMRVKTTFRPVQRKEIYSLVWQEDYIYFIVNRMVGMYFARQPKTGESSTQVMAHIVRLVLCIALAISDHRLGIARLSFAYLGQMYCLSMVVPGIPCHIYPIGRFQVVRNYHFGLPYEILRLWRLRGHWLELFGDQYVIQLEEQYQVGIVKY